MMELMAGEPCHKSSWLIRAFWELWKLRELREMFLGTEMLFNLLKFKISSMISCLRLVNFCQRLLLRTLSIFRMLKVEYLAPKC